jgi:membrane fusion protein (multidrug efflux system)
MNRKIIYYLVGITIIGLLAWPKIFPKNSEQNSPNAKALKANPIKVNVVVAQKQNIASTIQAIGNVMADEEVELHAETQGKITQIYFTEGSTIAKGKQLIKIDDGSLQAQLKKALITKKLKEQTENRNKQLLEKGGISEEIYEISLTDLNATKADIDLLKDQIKHTEITAPFNGKIGLKYVSVGSFVNTTTKIASIQKIDKVKIEFSIPERYVSQINNGTVVNFLVDGIQNSFEAVIYAIEPKVDAVNRNVLIRAVCNNTDGTLLPGMFAKVNVSLSNKTGVFLIPTQSIIPILKGQKVFLVKGDSVVEQKVEVSGRNDVNVEVVNGLKTGDSVVTSGIIQMKQGVKVKVQKGI